VFTARRDNCATGDYRDASFEKWRAPNELSDRQMCAWALDCNNAKLAH